MVTALWKLSKGGRPFSKRKRSDWKRDQIVGGENIPIGAIYYYKEIKKKTG